MNKTKERIKNVVIWVLLLGMVYLTYAVWFFDSPFEKITFQGLFGGGENYVIYEGTGSDMESFGIRPLGISIRDDMGQRGAIYENATSDALYKELRDSIADALGKTGEIITTTEAEWQKALLSKGVFLDYFGNIPIDVVRMWLGTESGESTACARYFLFDASGKTVTVYAKNSKSGAVYRLSGSYSSEALLEKLASLSVAKNISFAIEREEEDFRSVRNEMLIPENRAKIAAISANNAFEVFKADAENACLSAFRLRDKTSGNYFEQDGTAIYVADMITLKISPLGEVSYTDTRDAADETLGIEVGYEERTPTLAEKTESARTLATSIASALPGKGGLYISDVISGESATEIVFGRTVNGVPVRMKGTSYFIKVRIEDDMVKSAKVNLRYYEALPQNTDVFPERIAVAAVKGSGKSGDLILCYQDDGEAELSPEWHISGKGNEGGEKEDGVVQG